MITRVLASLISGLLAISCLQAAPASFAYILQPEAFAGDKPSAVAKLAECGRDWIVLDALYDNETAWQPIDLKTIREAKAGRKLIAYISIGEAEDYRAYWDKKWRSGPTPKWLGGENPHWKGNYRVDYWNPDWQAIIFKVVDDAMSAGFDGVYLDIVDGFEAFEKSGAQFIDDRPNPATKQSYRRDMVDWVKRIAARTRAKNPAALVIPQNGSQLLAHPDFVETISGIGIEDLFSEDDRPQPASHSGYVLGFLNVLVESRKPILVIEYPEREKSVAAAREANHRYGFTWLITDRELKTLGISGR